VALAVVSVPLLGALVLGGVVNHEPRIDDAVEPPPAALYLRQHGDNPINWFPWGEEALARAKAEDRPIFLSIGYASCHWCHVMEHEVFEDEAVAAFMNARFISIKVDREERPDLDAVYMEAVQALTGRGGWPLSVFLTPDGKPFFGGTYFPRDAFLEIAGKVHDVFTSQRAGVEQDGARLAAMVSAELQGTPGAPLERTMVARAAAQALSMQDAEWGGFRGRQKFPTPLRWRFLLHRYRKTGEARYADAVRRTLDNMGSGGIQDHLGGGFHRYTTEETWLIPHFEKMLYDNAQIASLYTEAAAVLGEARYAEIARDVLDFMLRDMRGEAGGFYASFDADSGGEEGSFYVWTPQEIEAVAGEDGAALAALLGVSESGNFEGSNVLTRRVTPAELARRLGRSEADIAALFARWREPLLQARSQRVAPGLDRKIVTAWNGLAIEALARAALAFGEQRYLDAAERAADYLWRAHRAEDGSLLRSSTDGVAANPAILDDYAFLARGLLALHQVSGAPEPLRRALLLIDAAREHFAHPDAGFYLTAAGQAAPLGRKVEVMDAVEPSGNAAMLHALLQAAALTGNRDHRSQAETMLRSHAGLLERAGLEMAAWLDAAELFLGPHYEVVVAGETEAADTEVLLDALRALRPAHAVIAQVAATGPSAELLQLAPALAGKLARSGRATAYVCQEGSCKAPTSDPAELRRQVLEGWER